MYSGSREYAEQSDGRIKMNFIIVLIEITFGSQFKFRKVTILLSIYVINDIGVKSVRFNEMRDL